jgi:hypothetical protein
MSIPVSPRQFLRFIRFAALAGVLAIIAVPCLADTIVTIDMANITFTGNNSCTPSPCKDVFNATWMWDTTTKSIVPSSMSVSNSGVLGNFSLYSITTYSFQFNSTTLPDYDASLWYFGSSFPALGAYPLSEVYLYCGGGVCSTDFGARYSNPTSGAVTVTNSPAPTVPEPSTLSLLGLGCGILAMAGFTSRRRHALQM